MPPSRHLSELEGTELEGTEYTADPDQPSPKEELAADRLFCRALDLPPHERSEFLDRACADRPRLRALVDDLLATDTHDWDEVLDAGQQHQAEWLRQAEETLKDDQTPGDHSSLRRLGPYRLVRELGQGGMGVVHLAKRDDGQFDQQVALKLLHLGSSRGRMARFRRERQILASLEHPGIARLLDGGVSPEGQPFLVMEYVDGRPIDRFIEERQLELEDRLRLFLDVCRAVSAAHRQLVVHRDLKPSNILVTSAGTVKLLDFGIAKLLTPETGEVSVEWTRAMTPSYASPEQFLGQRITVASDVYQLGLLLFRLLAGRLPYDVRTGSAAEAEELICRVPPPKASSMVRDTGLADPSPLSHFGGEDLASWTRTLRGDLDNIAAKALAKAPVDRYVSVDALIDDVDRYLAGQPVTARRPTLGYVSVKFLGRHRLAVGAVLVGLLVVTGLTVGYAVDIRDERDRAEAALAVAETAREEAELLSHSLVELFSLADPERGAEDPVDALELLDRSTEKMRSELAGQPLARARFLHALGEIYTKLDRKDRAVDVLAEALALREEHLGPEHAAVVETAGQLGVVLGQLGRFNEAERLLRRMLAAREGSGDPEELAVALNNLGNLEWRRGRLEQAEALHRQALDLRQTASPRDPVRVGDSANNLGVLLNAQGRGLEALPYLSLAAEAHLEAFGPDHPTSAVALNNLSGVEQSLGRYRQAEKTARRVLEIWRRAYGPDHERTLRAEYNVGLALVSQGRSREGVEVLRAVARRHEDVGGVDLARTYSALAQGLMDLGDLSGAAHKLDRALDIRTAHYGENHTATLRTRARIAQLRRIEGRIDAAITQLRQLAEILQGRENTGRLDAWVHHELGLALLARKDLAEARVALARAVELRSELLPADHPRLVESKQALGNLQKR